MSSVLFTVGQTPAQIELPPVAAVFVLNSSGGIGDRPDAPNIVIDNSSDCSLDPQVGCRLSPGRAMTFPMTNPANGSPLPLWAVADGPNATLTIQLITCD